MSKWVKIIIGLAVIAIVVVVIAFSATSGVVKAVEKHLALLKEGDVAGAYELTSGEFKNATSLAEFEAFVAQYPALSNNKSHSFTERSVENNMGTVRGSLTAEDGTVTPIKYTLVKERGEWRILSIEIGTEE